MECSKFQIVRRLTERVHDHPRPGELLALGRSSPARGLMARGGSSPARGGSRTARGAYSPGRIQPGPGSFVPGDDSRGETGKTKSRWAQALRQRGKRALPVFLCRAVTVLVRVPLHARRCRHTASTPCIRGNNLRGARRNEWPSSCDMEAAVPFCTSATSLHAMTNWR